jgi:hypothetical protein
MGKVGISAMKPVLHGNVVRMEPCNTSTSTESIESYEGHYENDCFQHFKGMVFVPMYIHRHIFNSKGDA